MSICGPRRGLAAVIAMAAALSLASPPGWAQVDPAPQSDPVQEEADYQDAAERREVRDAITLYQSGDFATALARLKPLADRGVDEAQYYIGFMHAQGLGVPNDYAEAAKWYKRAALQGHAQSQNYLGLLYYEGRGVPRDFRRAFIFFELAAAAGNEDAASNRLIVARKMTSEKITEAQQEAGRIIAKMRSDQHIPVPRRLASGVIVTAEGHVLTHQRAVGDCTDLKVRIAGKSTPAEVVAVDEFNGFAVLAVSEPPGVAVAFAEVDATPGGPVTVIGWRISDELAIESIITEAILESLPNLERVDERYLQIGALFDSTNLGAPVFDSGGNLIGILETGVSPHAVARVRGERPDLLSFALRQQIAHLLLQMNGIDYERRQSADPLDKSEFEALTRSVAVAVECWRGET